VRIGDLPLSARERRDGVDNRLGLLELSERNRSTKTSDPALLEATFGETVVVAAHVFIQTVPAMPRLTRRSGDRREELFLDNVGIDIVDLKRSGPAERARDERRASPHWAKANREIAATLHQPQHGRISSAQGVSHGRRQVTDAARAT
jgi:hypothetical protein